MYSSENKANRNKFTRDTALFFFLCHIAVAWFFYQRAVYMQAYYWAALLVLVASLPYVIAMVTNNFILYESIYLFLGGFLLCHTAALFLPLADIGYNPDALAAAMRFAVLGILALIIGYKLKLGKAVAARLPLKNFVISESLIFKVPAKFYFAWLLLVILPQAKIVRLPGYLFAMVEALMRLLLFAAIMTDAYIYFSKPKPGEMVRRKGKYLLRMILFSAAYMVQTFLGGFSGRMVILFVLLYFVYIKVNKRISLGLTISLILFTMLFFTYIVPFTKTFRSAYWGGASISESINHAYENKNKETDESNMKFSIKRFSEPLNMAVVTSQLQKEGMNYYLYDDLVAFVARFIPRFIWRNKPTSFDWNQIGRDLGIIAEDDYRTSIGLPLLSGFIIGGGRISVFIGMLFVGIVLRIFWEWLIVRPGENFLTFSIYSILLYTWMFGGAEFGSIMVSSTMFLAYAYIFLGVIKVK